jgi:hypothetical protein
MQKFSCKTALAHFSPEELIWGGEKMMQQVSHQPLQPEPVLLYTSLTFDNYLEGRPKNASF